MPKPMTTERLNEIRAFEPATATPQEIGMILLELTNEVLRLRTRASQSEELRATARIARGN